jgi:hypothetical protein
VITFVFVNKLPSKLVTAVEELIDALAVISGAGC